MKNIRTKIEAVIAVMICLMLMCGSLFAVTRTISDTGDDVTTFIRNSKGNYWSATGANIQTAIDDLPATGGTVWCGDDITLTTEIHLKNYTILDFEGHTVTLSANITFINLTGGNWNNIIKDVVVSVPNYHTNDVIILYIAPSVGWSGRIRNNLFDNIRIDNSNGAISHNYTGIHFFLNNAGTDSGDLGSIQWNIFRNFYIYRAGKGIYLESCSGTYGYGGGNTFSDFMIDGATRGIEWNIPSDVLGYGGTSFNGIKMQANSWTTYAIGNITGSYNYFINCMVYDWWPPTYTGQTGYQWYIDYGASYTYILSNYIDLTAIRALKDLGNYTYIHYGLGNYGDMMPRQPYDYIIYQNGSYTYARESETGSIVYKNTNARTTIAYVINNLAPSSLYFKKGIYVINSYFVIQSDISFIGEDKKNVIFRCENNTSFTGGMFYVNGADNVTFRDITFDGNGSDAISHNIGIYIMYDESPDSITIENCVFTGWNATSESSAIQSAWNPTSDITSNLKIRNCEFYNNYYGIRLRGDADSSIKQTMITGNYFNYVNTYNMYLCTLNNCTVTNNIVYGGTYGIYLKDSLDNILSNNIIYSTTGITEQGTSNYNIIALNDCRSCTTPIDINGANTVNTTNLGTIS